MARRCEPGDRVAVQVEKSIEALVLYLATVRAGGVFLPLNTAYTPAEVDYFLDDAEPRGLRLRSEASATSSRRSPTRPARRSRRSALAGGGERRPTSRQGARRRRAVRDRWPADADDLAAILYTSGTTGRSKGAMLTHGTCSPTPRCWRRPGASPRTTCCSMPCRSSTPTACSSPRNTLMVAGGALIFLPKFDLDEVFEYLPQATSMMGVPTFYTRLLADDRAEPRGRGAYAAVHLRLRAAARRDAPRLRGSAPASASSSATA